MAASSGPFATKLILPRFDTILIVESIVFLYSFKRSINWSSFNIEIPFCLAFTKIDKLGKNQWASNFAKYKKRLMDYWGELPQLFEKDIEFLEENLKIY